MDERCGKFIFLALGRLVFREKEYLEQAARSRKIGFNELYGYVLNPENHFFLKNIILTH